MRAGEFGEGEAARMVGRALEATTARLDLSRPRGDVTSPASAVVFLFPKSIAP